MAIIFRVRRRRSNDHIIFYLSLPLLHQGEENEEVRSILQPSSLRYGVGSGSLVVNICNEKQERSCVEEPRKSEWKEKNRVGHGTDDVHSQEMHLVNGEAASML